MLDIVATSLGPRSLGTPLPISSLSTSLEGGGGAGVRRGEDNLREDNVIAFLAMFRNVCWEGERATSALLLESCLPFFVVSLKLLLNAAAAVPDDCKTRCN